MQACNLTLLSLDWPEPPESHGLMEIDLDVLMDLDDRVRLAQQGRFPDTPDGKPMAGRSTRIAKGLGLSEDSYLQALVRLRNAGLVAFTVVELPAQTNETGSSERI